MDSLSLRGGGLRVFMLKEPESSAPLSDRVQEIEITYFSGRLHLGSEGEGRSYLVLH